MFDRSRYSALIHNEIKKVRETTGLCCSSRICCNDTINNIEENKALLSEVLTDNGNCRTVDIFEDNLDETQTARSSININATNRQEVSDINTNRNSCHHRQCDIHSDEITKISKQDEALILNALLEEMETGRRNNCCVRSRRNNNNTNVYRFLNQNFPDNATGRTNVNISAPEDNNALRKAQIQQILRKYGLHGMRRR